jgi:hypothetical protein
VRNRVAGSRTRSLVTMGLVALMMLGSGSLAFAQGGPAAGTPFNFAGPVGIAAAAIGLSGMLLGLWRFRRKLARDRAANTAVIPVVDASVLPVEAAPARTS